MPFCGLWLGPIRVDTGKRSLSCGNYYLVEVHLLTDLCSRGSGIPAVHSAAFTESCAGAKVKDSVQYLRKSNVLS